MPKRIVIPAALAVVALCFHQYMIWFYAPVAQSGLIQKIFYMHLPCSWWALMSFLTVFVASLLFLVRRDPVYDRVAGAAAEIGVLLATLTLATGSIWGRAEWGAWWIWEPKLTTALIMWYVYAGYLVLRSTPMGLERRMLVCAVLGVVAFVDVPLVFFAAKLWGEGAHPVNVATTSSGMAPTMWHTVLSGLVAFGLLWVSILQVRVGQLNLKSKMDAKAVWTED